EGRDLDVRPHLRGEALEQAGDDPLLLGGEIATGAVSDAHQPALHLLDVELVSGTGLDALQPPGDVLAAELARRALPARLDVEKTRDLQHGVHHARRVVEHPEASRAEARTRRP